jgi:hypothetical protein
MQELPLDESRRFLCLILIFIADVDQLIVPIHGGGWFVQFVEEICSILVQAIDRGFPNLCATIPEIGPCTGPFSAYPSAVVSGRCCEKRSRSADLSWFCHGIPIYCRKIALISSGFKNALQWVEK